MEFAGNKFTYVSKNKITKLNELKKKQYSKEKDDVVCSSEDVSNKMELDDIIEDFSETKAEKNERLGRGLEKNTSLIRNRSNSVEMISETELDNALSENEDEEDYVEPIDSGFPKSNNLFGNNAFPMPSSSTGGLFGNNAFPMPTSSNGGLFGNTGMPMSMSQPSTGNLSGNDAFPMSTSSNITFGMSSFGGMNTTNNNQQSFFQPPLFNQNTNNNVNNNLFAEKKKQKKNNKKPKDTYNVGSYLKANNHTQNHVHEVDTNIVSINLGFLSTKVEYATGDPYECSSCKAILNKFSNIQAIPNSMETIWVCEFCEHKNSIVIDKEEVPKTESIDYFVQSFNQICKDLKNLNFNDEQHIIICFDISGSMCVSEPLHGRHIFKGKENFDKTVKDLMQFSDGSNQHYGGSNSLTYVSRLQCLQAAIENNIQNLLKHSPRRKLGIVVFNNEVIAIGDGTKEKVVINGNNLNDYDFISKKANETQGIVANEISNSADLLLKQLYSVEEGGQTALGPAILYSINLINGSAPGSKIILCTDGMANLGLGALDNLKTDEEISQAKTFYQELGNIAKSKGIIVNLITFEGEESKISILSTLSELTGGDIIRVKPTEILEQFSNVLSNDDIVASNVQLKVKLHKALCFRNEDASCLQNNNSTLVKDIGNARGNMELPIEYAFKKSEDLLKENIDIDSMKSVPFQSIISYITKNGDKCIRVITSEQQISSDRDEVEKQAKLNLVSVNAIKKTTELAKQGHYREAQSNALAWKKMIKNSAKNNFEANQNLNSMAMNLNPLHNKLQRVQFSEMTSSPYPMTQTTTTQRLNNRNDELSSDLYMMNNNVHSGNVNSTNFNKKRK